MNEIWKDIKGYEGLYQISNLGRVRSVSRYVYHNQFCPQKIISLAIKRNGYVSVGLRNNNIRKYYSVHRLVAEAFIPNPENKLEVNHKNGIKTDNRVENLEWVTHSENQCHSYKVLNRQISGSYAKHKIGKENPYSKIIFQIDKNKIIAEFYGLSEAERITKISRYAIRKVCQNKRKTAGGYKWKFKE